MHVVIACGKRLRGELLDLHRRPESLKERRHTSFALPYAEPGCGGRRRVGGPVHVVGHSLEDRGDVTASEGFVQRLDALDVVVGTH
jgi:hypothetical protein